MADAREVTGEEEREAREYVRAANDWAESHEQAVGLDEDSFVAGAEWQARRAPIEDAEPGCSCGAVDPSNGDEPKHGIGCESEEAKHEDAEPVAYEQAQEYAAQMIRGASNFAKEMREQIRVAWMRGYEARAPQPAKPIEVTPEAIEAAVEAFKHPRRMVTNTSDGNQYDRMEAAIEVALKEMNRG